MKFKLMLWVAVLAGLALQAFGGLAVQADAVPAAAVGSDQVAADLGRVLADFGVSANLEGLGKLLALVFLVSRILLKYTPAGKGGAVTAVLEHLALNVTSQKILTEGNKGNEVPANTSGVGKTIGLAGLLAAGLMLGGCATQSINATTYNAEALITDAATAATHVFNLQYHDALLGTNPPKNIDQLNATRDQFYAADRQLAAALETVDALRAQYVASGATNATQLLAALAVAQNQAAVLNTLTNLISTLK